MYQKYQFKNIIEASQSKVVNEITDKDLCIFDIDGVFFNNLFDFREFIGVARRGYIQSFRNISHKAKYTWIFTDRPYFLHWLHITKQLADNMNEQPQIFKDCKEFINNNKVDLNTIIFSAQKSKMYSKYVITAAIDNFPHVYYFAAQDLPWVYHDETLLNNLSKDIELKNLTFIDIRKHFKLVVNE